MHPLVSVIVPVYNMSKYLEQCLDSIQAQTLKEIEIICIDDGSTDNSMEILLEKNSQDSRIRILQQENKGSGAARNKGMQIARGEYIAFMDSDDWYPSANVLEELYNSAKKFHVDIAGGSLICWDDELTSPSNEYVFSSSGMVSFSDYQISFFYQRFIYSRRMLMEHGIVFPYYLRGQDPPFLVKAMTTAGSFYATQLQTYCYRVGHKKINWDIRKANDYMKCIIDLLQLSVENSYPKLHVSALMGFQRHYCRCIKLKMDVNNPSFSSLIREANGYIRPNLVKEGGSDIFTKYFLSPCSGIVFGNSAGFRIVRYVSCIKSMILLTYLGVVNIYHRGELLRTYVR